MKKKTIYLILLTMLLTICFVSCDVNPDTSETDQEQPTQIEDLMEYIMENRYWSEMNDDEFWEDLEGYEHAYEKDVIPDAETAMKVASVLIENVKKDGLDESFELFGVTNDNEKGVWIVSFAKADDVKQEVASSCYNIALDKKTGEVILMWPG